MAQDKIADVIEGIEARIEQYKDGLITAKEMLGSVLEVSAQRWEEIDMHEACNDQAL